MTKKLQLFGSYIMLLGIISAALRYNHALVYALFGMGFLCNTLSHFKKDWTLIIKYLPFILLPVLAVQFPSPVPEEWPGLIRLASTLAIWVLILIALFGLLSLFLSKQPSSHDRKETER